MAEMTSIKSAAELRPTIATWRRENLSIGFVPTMGALHEGHLTLVREARAKCDRVVVSIFVNPTQFGPNEDFNRYPRQEEQDSTLLQQAGCDLVFLPDVAEIYPDGYATSIHVSGLTENLCGAFRPGHFDGVATIVAKLFNLVMPDRAFFGEKDYQQLQVIKRLTQDLNLPIEITGVPTVREPDGLALSSRNAYLTETERKIAPMIFQTLTALAKTLKSGEPAAPLLEKAKQDLRQSGFSKLDYLELVDAENLQPLNAANRPARLLVAAFLGKTRLIDNVAV
jgi:pantoate--beta-alanine ligase